MSNTKGRIVQLKRSKYTGAFRWSYKGPKLKALLALDHRRQNADLLISRKKGSAMHFRWCVVNLPRTALIKPMEAAIKVERFLPFHPATCCGSQPPHECHPLAAKKQ